MDEELLRQVLAAQEGVEFAPTEEMMMMNSADLSESIFSNANTSNVIQQSQRPPSNPPVAISSTKSTILDDDSFEDETILERIIALREMFPDCVQNAVFSLRKAAINGSKLAFNKGRTVTWWLSSTMCVLVFPILIQRELLQVAEQISREQRSILLGPQAATGAISGGAF